jgi:hypothetical protein
MSQANAAATLNGTRLFGHQLVLQIGYPNDPDLAVDVNFNASNSSGLDTGGITGIDVDFVVEKDINNTSPNTCSIKLYNLNDQSRNALSGGNPLTVKLEAGYVGGTTQIFFAQARAAWSEREGPTTVTRIESTDTVARVSGNRKTKQITNTAALYKTMGARVPIKQAFQAIAGVMGVKVGNLNQALAGISVSLSQVNGAALLGNSAQVMTDLCRSAGLEWWIDDGNLCLVNIGGYLSSTAAILLSEDTGLVGSPSVDSSGALSAKCRIIPGFVPGVQVSMQSLFVSGGYRVEKCRYKGSTRGKEWDIDFDAVKY